MTHLKNSVEDLNAIDILTNQLSHIQHSDEIQFSSAEEAWPTTRAWLISPEKLPYYPKFIKHVDQQYSTLNKHSATILQFYQSLPYAETEFWDTLLSQSPTQQLEALLNCCALAVINDHLHTSDALHELQIIQNYLSCYVLDNPQKFRNIIVLASQLNAHLTSSKGLSNFLEELDSAQLLPDASGPNILPSVLARFKRQYNIDPPHETEQGWRGWLRDATDQFSENIKEFFTSTIPIPQVVYFSGQSRTQRSSILWEDAGCELSLVNIDGRVLLKWSGIRALEAIYQNQTQLSCTNQHSFNQHIVQFWGPIERPIQQLSFYDGRDAYRLNIQSDT